MTENTTCADTHPDVEIIDKLVDAIMTVCDRQRALKERRTAMCKELAALLCPFAEGERIRIPRPAHAGNHDEGEIRGVWFDPDYGYHLYLGYDDGRQGTVPAYMNAELELCNGKEPALPATLRDKCLYLLRDSLSYV